MRENMTYYEEKNNRRNEKTCLTAGNRRNTSFLPLCFFSFKLFFILGGFHK